MLILDIETEENLQCGVTSGGGAKGGGGGLATQGSTAIVSTKKASGAPSRSAGQPAARALDAAFGELARRGTTGRVQNPTLSPAQRKSTSGAAGGIATKAQRAKAINGYLKSTGQSTTKRAPALNAARTAPKAAKAPTNVAQQNRDRIARGKAKAEKAKAKAKK